MSFDSQGDVNPISLKVYVKVKASHYRPRQALMLQEIGAPRICRLHMKVVRLSSLRAGRPYLPVDVPGTHFCYRLSRSQGVRPVGLIQ
jgi:hypothetical protein